MADYICFNGDYLKSDKEWMGFDNRAFLYGDALFETIHANGTTPQFMNFHAERLLGSLKILKMQIPAYFDKAFLTKCITGLLVRNKFFKGARVRLTVFRNPGGLYTPEDNTLSFVIDCDKLESDLYALNTKGLLVDIYQEIKKPLNILAGLKTTNALLFVMAGIYKNSYKFDDCLLLNENNKIIESISSNLFIVNGKSVFTPSLSEGCLPGVMRKVMIDILQNRGYRVFDNCSLEEKDIKAADEMFLTNAISGIRWILGYKQKRYYHDTSKMLIKKLNELAFPHY